MTTENTIDWETQKLIPAIIQDQATGQVLMLGYMNQETWQRTLDSGTVTFFSRSRNEIWVKGETSGNFLRLVSWKVDCDADTLLLQVHPEGPVCHTGSTTCFGEPEIDAYSALKGLVHTIDKRYSDPQPGSYIASLREKGIHKIAQKVGEESVELVIEAMRDEPELFLEEAADLLFHYLLLLRAGNKGLEDVMKVLEGRKR